MAPRSSVTVLGPWLFHHSNGPHACRISSGNHKMQKTATVYTCLQCSVFILFRTLDSYTAASATYPSDVQPLSLLLWDPSRGFPSTSAIFLKPGVAESWKSTRTTGALGI